MFGKKQSFSGLFLKEATIKKGSVVGKSISIGDKFVSEDGEVVIKDITIHIGVGKPDVQIVYDWKSNGKSGNSKGSLESFLKSYAL